VLPARQADGSARGAEPDPDDQVVGQVRSGEIDRYAVLVRRYQTGLFRYALGMVSSHDVASDLVQDTFVKAYASLDLCRDPSRFGTWIFRILRNRCLDHLKDRRRRDVPLDAHLDLATEGSGEGAEVERWGIRQAIDRALAKLPEPCREAFILKHVHDLSYGEMAEMLEASESALRMRVLRAREMLQALLAEERAVS
jgi:RNA polymerase sigma-70 factor, ECF subfamily